MQCVHCGAINLKEDRTCVECGKDIYEFTAPGIDESRTEYVRDRDPVTEEVKVLFIDVPETVANRVIPKFPYHRLVTFSIVMLAAVVPIFIAANSLSHGPAASKDFLETIKHKPEQLETEILTNDSLNEDEKNRMLKDIEEQAAKIKTMSKTEILGSAIEEIKKAKTMQIRSALLNYYSQNNTFPDKLKDLYPNYIEEEPKSWLNYKADSSKTSFSLEFELSQSYKGPDDFVFEEGGSKVFRLTGAY